MQKYKNIISVKAGWFSFHSFFEFLFSSLFISNSVGLGALP